MKNIKKRIISVLFVLLILCNFIFIPVYADDVSDVYALFTTDWGHSVLKNQYYQYLSQTDDDFYMNHMQNFNFDATYYQIQQFANRVERAGLNAVAPIGLQIVGDIVYDNLEIATGAKYKSALVDRELLLAMDNTIVHNIGQNGVRYTSLDELGLTTNNTVTTTGITVQYSSQVCPFLGKSFTSSPIRSYYVLTNAYENTSQITFYTGGAMPPAFYVPNGCVVYQNGRALDSKSFYVILGTSELFRFALTTQYSYVGFGWFNNTDTINDARIIGSNTNTFGDDGGLASGWNSSIRIWSNGYPEDSTIFGSKDTNGRAWTYISLLNNLSGFMIDVDETPTTTAPDTFLPDTVPYDDDGFVYVFIPVDNSDNVSYGDIIYMNPEDYDTYVNNGTIVEGDYINTYSYDTATSIIDSYNTYITNNNTTNNYNFDDTRIVGRLDNIDNTLKTIKLAIENLKNDSSDVFSPEPVYEDFSDCYRYIPILSSIYNIVDGMKTNQVDDGISSVRIAQTNNQLINTVYGDFRIDLSWYEPYRENIRQVLRIGVWGWGIVIIWRKVSFVPNGENPTVE